MVVKRMTWDCGDICASQTLATKIIRIAYLAPLILMTLSLSSLLNSWEVFRQWKGIPGQGTSTCESRRMEVCPRTGREGGVDIPECGGKKVLTQARELDPCSLPRDRNCFVPRTHAICTFVTCMCVRAVRENAAVNASTFHSSRLDTFRTALARRTSSCPSYGSTPGQAPGGPRPIHTLPEHSAHTSATAPVSGTVTLVYKADKRSWDSAPPARYAPKRRTNPS